MSRRKKLSNGADWLQLVEPEGQFLTLPVLRRTFPNGFDVVPDAIRDELHGHYPTGDVPAEDAWDNWFEWLLRDALSWGERYCSGDAAARYRYAVPEHDVVVQADAILDDPEQGKPRVLALRYPHGVQLDKRVATDRWNASPIDRTMQLCRANDVRIGLVSDGERIALIWIPAAGTTGYATWDTSLFLESKERELLRAFISLLGASRFFAVSENDQLEALFEESEKKQSEITDRLGYQVRQAVELLVGAISRANLERNGELLRGIAPQDVYAAAVTVLMRLVFLLYAEERDLLPLDEPLYAEHYAASTLREQLDEQATLEGDAPLERRSAAWYRLLALFRVIYYGTAHDRLRLPAYGGRLFDPQRFTFLEDLPVDDLTVRAMLEAIQTIEEPGTRERRHLSYRTLDVEQIGHVYEGLLDHGTVRVDDVYVRLIGRSGDEAELPLADLERAAGDGEHKLVSFLINSTKKSDGAVRKIVERGRILNEDTYMRRRLNTACENDTALAGRVSPFVYALDTDLHDLPTVFPAHSLVVKPTRARRDSGTAYTPRELAEEMVRYALEPLVYSPGPKDGVEPSEWRLRPSAELLGLKICDPAVGSGAFLVAVCRYLADRVVEAWIAEDPQKSKIDRDDLTLDARRAVADRCLYGVDKDAMAVEMAKLSLWLITLGRERPFSFLDHAIRHGDSLLGVTSLDQVRYVHLNPDTGRAIYDGALFDATAVVTNLVNEAIRLREQLEALPSRTVRDAEAKRSLNEQADSILDGVNVVADAITAMALVTAGHTEEKRHAAFIGLSIQIRAALDPMATELSRRNAIEHLRSENQRILNAGRPAASPPRVTFHWPITFAEIFAHGNFDLVTGNPPFMGGQKITGTLGTDYREYLVVDIGGGRRGSADLVAYFFLRAEHLTDDVAFLAVDTIAQGDTREIALDVLIEEGWKVYRAIRTKPWPGNAGVYIAELWLCKSLGSQPVILDGAQQIAITSWLTPRSRISSKPHRLAENHATVFQGSNVVGTGFALSREQAQSLIERDTRNRDVLFPYLNAKDLCTIPDANPSRWIINFFDWPLERAATYPDCLDIVRRAVRPQRAMNNRARRRDYWWQYGETTPGLFRALATTSRVIAMPLVSKVVLPLMYSTDIVFAHKLAVVVSGDIGLFGTLSSTLHRAWARRYGSTRGTGTNYSPSDCFETFPFRRGDVRGVAEGMQKLDEYRRNLMLSLNVGLTKLYNRVHDPVDHDPSIEKLREMHAELDRAACNAYDWTDLDLGYGFHETDEGTRWTIARSIRDEILDRLLELNHQRHAEEVERGLVARSNKAGPRRPEPSAEGSQPSLL